MQFLSVKKIVKQSWLIVVLFFAAYFVYSRFDTVILTVQKLPLYTLILAVLLIVVGKILLSANMMFAARQAGIEMSYADSFRIYNMTQLAKYIPGSIWQFVGRVVILRERGASNSAIRDSMLAEHAWVMGSAFSLAVVAIGIFSPSFIQVALQRFDLVLADIYLYLLGAVVITLLATVLMLKVTYKWLLRMRPSAVSLITLAGVWVALGMAFWMILPPFIEGYAPWHYVIGLYSLAYVIGFLVPFAPAGLGVRESILAFGLLPYMGIETALLMAGINRIAYFVAEIFVVLPFIKDMFKTKLTNVNKVSF